MSRQLTRDLAFRCALGEDILWIRRFRGSESLSGASTIQVDLLSDDPDVDLNAILGLHGTIRIGASDQSPRFLDGIVTEVDLVGMEGRYTLYRAVLRPWFWLLTRTTNCRFFQDKSVMDIVKEVFRSHGHSDFEDRVVETLPTREFCVQYRETDFAFVSRLLEEEGIYYYFRHEDGKHTLVLADSKAAHETVPELAELPYGAAVIAGRDPVGQFSDWRLKRKIQSGKVALKDFNFQMPSADLNASSSDPKPHAEADHEAFDYPGRYEKSADGSRHARTRMEEQNTRHEVVHATSDARGLPCGALFRLVGHPRADQNKEYVTTSMRYEAEVAAYESGQRDERFVYRVFVTAMDSAVPFRPERTTPKAFVPGPQTAIVVGSGAVWTDEHARIKVRFHWDREGKESCWIRVSQAWASAQFGSMHLPHVGDEVVVSFLEGDPDRPLVTGRVYNGTNQVWRPLPAEPTKSYFRDMGGNHIYMDERKGAERIELFSPYGNTKLALGAPNSPQGLYMTTDLDMTHHSGGNSETTVDGQSKVEIQGNSEEIYKANFQKLVEQDVKNIINGNCMETICKNVEKYIKGNKKEEIRGSDTKKIFGLVSYEFEGPKKEVTIGVTNSLFVGARSDHYIAFKHENVIGAKVDTIGGMKAEVGYAAKYTKVGGRDLFVGKSRTETIAGTYQVNANDIKHKAPNIFLDSGGLGRIYLASGKGPNVKIFSRNKAKLDAKSVAITGQRTIDLKASTTTVTGRFKTRNLVVNK